MPGDIASEIFGRLRQLNDEQRGKDYDKQNQLVKLYGSLAEQIEPDSMGTYLQGFEKLMFPSNMTPKGFDKKGFMNFVRSVSGMPSDDYGTRLGSEFRNLTSKFMGPERAAKAKQSWTAQMATPNNEMEMANREQVFQDERNLPDSIVLRDPRQEALQKIQTQYGLQYQQKMNELATREQNMRERQRLNDERDFGNRWELAQHNSTLKSRQDIFNEAMKVAGKYQRRYPTDTDYDEAIGNISRRDNLNEEILRNRSGYLKAQANKAEMETGVMRESGGMKPADLRAERQFAQGQYSDARKVYDTWAQSREKARGYMPNISAMESRLEGIAKKIPSAPGSQGAYFDKTKRTIVTPEGLGLLRADQAVLDDYLKMLKEEAAVKAEMRGAFEQLQGMPDYIENIGGSEWDDIRLKKGIAPRPGIKRQGDRQPQQPETPSRPLPRAGLTTSAPRPVIKIPSRVDRTYQPNEIINMSGIRYRIMDIAPDGTATARIVR
jgi:hypothetical protein